MTCRWSVDLTIATVKSRSSTAVTRKLTSFGENEINLAASVWCINSLKSTP